jgi:methyl-accepting chemotaxis protein
MWSTLTKRCCLAFFALELLFGPLVAVAFEQLVGIEGYAPAHWLLAAAVLLKAALWAPYLVKQLGPYEEFARASRSAQSAALVARADAALQSLPYRFGAFYAFAWIVAYGTASVLLFGVAGAQVPIGARAYEAVGLLLLAVGFGSFAFGFPLIGMLTANAASECWLFARKQGILLDRITESLQFRIGVIAIALALGPTLWMAALGYAKQVAASQQDRTLRVQLAASELAGVAREKLREGSASSAALATELRQRAAPPLAAWLLDPAGSLVSADGAAVTSEQDRELVDWARAHRSEKTALFTRADSERVAGLVRIDGERAVVAVLTAPVAAPSGFVLSAGIFVLVVGIWAPICALILARAISRPIEQLTRAVRAVVEDGELSKMGVLPVVQSDEVGILTEKFNDLMDLMQGLASAAKSIAQGDLRIAVAGKGELPDAFRSMLANLREIVGQIGDTSADLASAAAEIFAASQEQESAAASQSSAMIEISRTMDSLSDSAAHVSEAVQGVLGNAERTLKNTDEMVQRIGQLSSHASRIGEILEVIRDIADKSDLLALNGSLEASRAGESGRGFALVAGEMRRLAERVTASVHDVKKLVYDIRESGSSTVMATEESRKLAEGTTEAARQITFVTQQQRSGTEQVSQSVKNIADVVAQAVSATSQTRTSAQSLKTRADGLAAIVRRFHVAAPEVA